MKYFNKEGQEQSAEKGCVAKCSDTVYFVSVVNGNLFDPLGIDSFKTKQVELVKVKKDCFDLYVKFLSGRSQIMFTRAERELHG